MNLVSKEGVENGVSLPKYHLRFQIIPDSNVRRNAKKLASLCLKHEVDEVVLFIAAEEWNDGLLSKVEEDRWYFAIKEAKQVLEKHGIAVSLNPWMTVLHADRGRQFPRDAKFQPMVSPTGKISKACASFADENWQMYVANLYGRFAELGFRVIWVEDDFRFHNHVPLDWGGGFEQLFIKKFSKRIGSRVTRSQVLQALLKPGVPHPWRKVWMSVWREVKLQVAKKIADAVVSRSPVPTKIGLMSSEPAQHSLEGRDWKVLFESFSIQGQVAHRPHFQLYDELPGRTLSFSYCMLDLQKDFRTPNCEVAPEIENFPFSAWNKSDSLTWAQMVIACMFGSDALLLDLFPFSGNSASEEPAVWRLLYRSRPALEWLGERFTAALETEGIGVPWHQHAQEQVRTMHGQSIQELIAPDCTVYPASDFLMQYGVAVSMRKKRANAIFGKLAWIFTDREIREFLSGGVLLDSISASILCERGFGVLIGLKSVEIVGREDDSYAVERITTSESGAQPGINFNINSSLNIGKLHLRKGAKEWTTILRANSEKFGPGMVAYENRLGGRVITYAAADLRTVPKSYQRQAVLHRAMQFCAGKGNITKVVGGPHLLVEDFSRQDTRYITVMNLGVDSALPVVQLGNGPIQSVEASLLIPLETPVDIKVQVSSKSDITHIASVEQVPYLGVLVLTIY